MRQVEVPEAEKLPFCLFTTTQLPYYLVTTYYLLHNTHNNYHAMPWNRNRFDLEFLMIKVNSSLSAKLSFLSHGAGTRQIPPQMSPGAPLFRRKRGIYLSRGFRWEPSPWNCWAMKICTVLTGWQEIQRLHRRRNQIAMLNYFSTQPRLHPRIMGWCLAYDWKEPRMTIAW